MKRILTALIACSLLPQAYGAYSTKNRLKLLDDKLQTEEMLRPFGHDFLFDTNVTVNKNLFDFLDDMKKVSKLSGDDANAKYTEGVQILDKYMDTEQNIRFRTHLGVPLPSFSAWGAKVVPDFRFNGGLTGLFSFQRERLTSFSALLPNNIPAELKATVDRCVDDVGLPAAGQSVLAHWVTGGCITEAQSNLIKSEVGSDILMIEGLTTAELPVIDAYVMASAKLGPQFNISKDHFFGLVSMYGLGRVDVQKKVTVAMVTSGADVMDIGEEWNTTIDMASDLRFGYKNANYSLWTGVEELKIARMKDNKAKAGVPAYGTDPLVRLHGEAEFRLGGIWMAKPFLGTHMRSGYDAADGIYGGADWGAHFFEDRIAFQLRTMADPEHFTLSPRLKLWFTQLEYSLKQPMKAKVDGIKVSTIHSLDFRLFF